MSRVDRRGAQGCKQTLLSQKPHGCWLCAGLQGLQGLRVYVRIYIDVLFHRFFSRMLTGKPCIPYIPC